MSTTIDPRERSAQQKRLADADLARLSAEGFVTVRQAAAELSLSVSSVRRLCADDEPLHPMTIVRTGKARGAVRIPLVALRAYKRRAFVPLRDRLASQPDASPTQRTTNA